MRGRCGMICPAVAAVFATGVIDFPMVSIIIAAPRTCARTRWRGWMRHRAPVWEVDAAVEAQVAGPGGSVGGQTRPGRGAGAPHDR
jgi:hypothetical protein